VAKKISGFKEAAKLGNESARPTRRWLNELRANGLTDAQVTAVTKGIRTCDC
jgi:hypothetical protein